MPDSDWTRLPDDICSRMRAAIRGGLRRGPGAQVYPDFRNGMWNGRGRGVPDGVRGEVRNSVQGEDTNQTEELMDFCSWPMIFAGALFYRVWEQVQHRVRHWMPGRLRPAGRIWRWSRPGLSNCSCRKLPTGSKPDTLMSSWRMFLKYLNKTFSGCCSQL